MIIKRYKCSKCQKWKAVSSFCKDNRLKRGVTSWCKKCQAAYWRKYKKHYREKVREMKNQYNKKHPEKVREYKKRCREKHPEHHRRSLLKQNYGMTLDDYNQLFIEQQGQCAICKKHQSALKSILNVDHNHITGKVRGLLCSACNRGLGNFDTDKAGAAYLQNAVKYIKAND